MRSGRSILAGCLFLVLALLVAGPQARADVYRELPLSAIEGFVLGFAGTRISSAERLNMQGQDFVVSRWAIAEHISTLSVALEARMGELLLLENGQGDGIQYVDDEFAVFAALPRQDGPHEDGLPTFMRTILLRANGAATEMTVTDLVGAPPEPERLAGMAQAMRWSLDGEWPEWRSSENSPTAWRQTLMFVGAAGDADRARARQRQLTSSGFNIVDVSTSQDGILISAINDTERVSAFSYIDEYGLNVEIVIHEIHTGGGE